MKIIAPPTSTTDGAIDNRITIEGYAFDQFLSAENDQIASCMFRDSVTLRIGSATILASFKQTATALVLELVQIEGGGEGVLLTLWSLAHRYARAKDLEQIEWIVHAITCAIPNIRLQRTLERKGFIIEDVAGYGRAYHLTIATKR